MKSRREFISATVLGCGSFFISPNILNAKFGMSPNVVSKLNDVNTTNIKGAIEMGCGTMSNVFNADDDNIPFFQSKVGINSFLGFSKSHSESHVPGRHLNALLKAEDYLGYKVEEGVIEKHSKAAFFSYSGAVPLPLNREVIDGDLVRFLPHNTREGFYALYALAKYRNSKKAMSIAEESIEFIFNHWNPVDGWDKGYFSDVGVKLIENESGPFIIGIARAIGPLVKYYQATGYARALELAIVLKDKAVQEYFTPDGSYDINKFGTHTHSTTSVMSSLAQLGELTSDSSLISRVKAFFDYGLKDISDELGWSIENAKASANPDRGEANNTGDILETALILGHSGYPFYFHIAEVILRGHLLPSQLRDISFIKEPSNPSGEDGRRNVALRHKGAFGFPAPYGHRPVGIGDPSFNMDIVGGVVSSLCEAYSKIYTFDILGHKVNLLFDYESDGIIIESPYTKGNLRIKVKRQAPLFIRIPEWLSLSSLSIKGVESEKNMQNGYLFISTPPVDQFISIDFTLPLREIQLSHRTRKIRAKLRGDEIIGMENFGTELTFFDPL